MDLKLLLPFCARQDGRYSISTPWVKGGWVYATDGRIMVRLPTMEPDTVRRDIPPTAHLFPPGIAEAATEPFRLGDTFFCDNCESIRSMAKIKEGILSPNTCYACKGNEKASDYRLYFLGKGWFEWRCCKKIVALPDVRYFPPLNADDCLFFSFAGGGEGICMPRTPPALSVGAQQRAG